MAAKKKVKAVKKPNKLQTEIDAFLVLRKEISTKEKAVKLLKSEASDLADKLMIKLETLGLSTSGTDLGKITLNSQNIGTIEDIKKLEAYVKKNNAPELIKLSLGQAAYRERLEAGERMGGVTNFIRKSLGYTKLKG